MADTKFFQNISVNPKDVTDLKELIPLSIDQDEEFQRFVNIKKVRNGDPVAFLGDMDDVGLQGSGCDPTYQEIGIANSQKRWELGDWQIPIKICYEALAGTIAEYSLKAGTPVGDLTSTDFMTYIIRPALERQMKRMIWRFAWFGDTEAKKQAQGGILTDDAKLANALFTTNDGLFKRIFAQGAANAAQVTAIAANNAQTWAQQKAGILTKGVATTIMDTMLMDADSRITSDPSAVVLMTKAFADALTLDVKRTYSTIMPWEVVSDGLEMVKYDGVTIVKVSIWDRMIKSYEKASVTVGSGENAKQDFKYNKPFRLVYANPNTQLQVGTNADGLISDLDIWFDKKERRNYIYSTGKIGTQILEDDMYQAAY